MRNILVLLCLLGGVARADPKAAAPDSLTVFFDNGSAVLSADALATLDHASQIYRQGNPIIMQVTGATDSTGTPDANLRLSELRARAVLQGLVARGIPAERFQLVAKGETEPAVPASGETAEPRDRRVDITWR